MGTTDLLLLQVRPVDAAEEDVCHDLLGVVGTAA